jgi:DNA-binding NarL/FixJ family response regulator
MASIAGPAQKYEPERGVGGSMASALPPPRLATDGKLAVGVCAEGTSLRERVCRALTAWGHAVSARSATVADLVAACKRDSPACVVVAAHRPDHGAVTTVRLIRSSLGSISGVLVCERANGADVRRALELGVDGVVLIDELEDALAIVVAAVGAGQVSVPRGRRVEVRAPVLTSREKQTLGLLVTGLTNAQIAGKLFLAESTVKSHLSSAFRKLGVSSRNEAVTLILDPERGRGLGILPIPFQRIPSRAYARGRR